MSQGASDVLPADAHEAAAAAIADLDEIQNDLPWEFANSRFKSVGGRWGKQLNQLQRKSKNSKLSIDDVHKTWELLCRFYQDAVSQKHLLESFRTGAPAHQAWLQTSTRDAAAVMRAVHVLRAHMLGLEDGPEVHGRAFDGDPVSEREIRGGKALRSSVASAHSQLWMPPRNRIDDERQLHDRVAGLGPLCVPEPRLDRVRVGDELHVQRLGRLMPEELEVVGIVGERGQKAWKLELRFVDVGKRDLFSSGLVPDAHREQGEQEYDRRDRLAVHAHTVAGEIRERTAILLFSCRAARARPSSTSGACTATDRPPPEAAPASFRLHSSS